MDKGASRGVVAGKAAMTGRRATSAVRSEVGRIVMRFGMCCELEGLKTVVYDLKGRSQHCFLIKYKRGMVVVTERG